MEILRMDADLDELIARRATTRDIKQAAISKGFRQLAEDGLRRVLRWFHLAGRSGPGN
jgi:type II secretory ATPase GspE/PulE/Tfp pilus assembly ATPase PilB-like protein